MEVKSVISFLAKR